jgi:uncharacterized protein YkwD
MDNTRMNTGFQAYGSSVTTPLPVLRAPLRAVLAIACACVIAMPLIACGGSSGSETVSGSEPVQDNNDSTQPPPASAPPPPPDNNAGYNLGSTPQTVIDQCMSDTDKEMLTRVNDARAVGRACGSVNYPAAAALSWHCTLEQVAFAHSRDMGEHNFFSHAGSDGLSAGDRLGNAGYDWAEVGENIAAGQPTVSAVMSAWLNSPGHCANIMRAGYTETAAASYLVTGSDYPIYWTQLFARPR